MVEPVTTPLSLLGESPIWDAASGTIFWVDILQGEIHAWEAQAQRHQTWRVGQPIGAIALCASGRLIGALQQGFFYINKNDGQFHVIADTEAHLPGNRFN